VAETAAREAARREELARLNGPLPWKCHTCGHKFTRTGKKQEFPEATGFGNAVAFIIFGSILAGIAAAVPPASVLLLPIAAIILLASLGFLIAYGVERGLQQFHSYHPRCPNCSSPHCANVEEDV
jgi:hypothetical protein